MAAFVPDFDEIEPVAVIADGFLAAFLVGNEFLNFWERGFLAAENKEVASFKMQKREFCAEIQAIIEGQAVCLKAAHHCRRIGDLVESGAKAKIFGHAGKHIVGVREIGLGHVALAVAARGSAIIAGLNDVLGPGQCDLLAIYGVDS